MFVETIVHSCGGTSFSLAAPVLAAAPARIRCRCSPAARPPSPSPSTWARRSSARCPSKSYAQAATADSEQRWADAAALYREAGDRMDRRRAAATVARAGAGGREGRARAPAIADAGVARARGRTAGRFGARSVRAARGRAGRGAPAARQAAGARAVLERVPPALYARTRDRLREALRAGDGPDAGARTSRSATPRSTCLLCSTLRGRRRGRGGAAGARARHRSRTRRPDQHVALAACAAGLGETRAAHRRAGDPGLHPGPGRTDRFELRDLYLSNDWDRLRGDPKLREPVPALTQSFVFSLRPRPRRRRTRRCRGSARRCRRSRWSPDPSATSPAPPRCPV